MQKKKSNNIKDVFSVFFLSTKLYFSYAEECLKYMFFPVFGQLIGIILIFTVTYFFTTNIESIRAFSPIFRSDGNLFILLLILISPFMFIFIKAMFKYVIAMGSLNLFFYTLSDKKRKKKIDFNEYDNVIKRRLFQYVILLALMSLIYIIPPLCFLAPISAFLLCMSFQIFAFEPDNSPAGVLARSIETVKDNFFSVLVMVALCFFSTYVFFPSVFVWAADKVNFSGALVGISDCFIKMLPVDEFNRYADLFNAKIVPDSVVFSKQLSDMIISFLTVSFTLPFRACCFTGLYKIFDVKKIKEYSKESEEIIKRATKRKN